MNKIRLLAFNAILLSWMLLSGCADEAGQASELNYTLPQNWSLSEDIHKTPQHRKITLMTPSGNFAEMELLQGDQAFVIDSREYMTRYIQATLPTEALRENAEFDFGDVTRQGQRGYFMNVTVPGKTQVQFVLEFYQFANTQFNLFVVLTTEPGLGPEQQREFDEFLASITLGE